MIVINIAPVDFHQFSKNQHFQKVLLWINRGFQEKLSRAPNKFTSQTTKNYYTKTSCNVSNDFEFSNVSEEDVKKILLSLDTSKATGMDQIPAKFLRDGAEILALPLGNICKWSSPIIIRRRLLFACRWHLYLLSTCIF